MINDLVPNELISPTGPVLLQYALALVTELSVLYTLGSRGGGQANYDSLSIIQESVNCY